MAGNEDVTDEKAYPSTWAIHHPCIDDPCYADGHAVHVVSQASFETKGHEKVSSIMSHLQSCLGVWSAAAEAAKLLSCCLITC